MKSYDLRKKAALVETGQEATTALLSLFMRAAALTVRLRSLESRMAKRWRNYTNLPDAQLHAIYDAVRPPGLTAHDVEIKNHDGTGGRGMAYPKGSGYHATTRPFVVVSIPKTEARSRLRRHASGKRGYLPVTLGSRFEVFVYMMAHELRHLWQAKAAGKPRGMIYGARGKISERDACAYGLQMLRRYRRQEKPF